MDASTAGERRAATPSQRTRVCMQVAVPAASSRRATTARVRSARPLVAFVGCALLAAACGLAACSDDGAVPSTDVEDDGGTDADAAAPDIDEAIDADDDAEPGDVTPGDAADDDATSEPEIPCTVLFGRPSPNTGLDESMCRPACACDDLQWAPPVYDETTFEGLLRWENTEPFAPLEEDPYAAEEPPREAPDLVCAVVRESPDALRYRLETYPNEDAAWDDGAIPTHFGACGRCSTLDNLEVYLRVADLTTPVRACAFRGITAGEAATIACLMELGFDLPCAQVWYYNARHTQQECFSECIRALNEPFHLPDGSLNPCIACDEERSGDVFKAMAGRTRRNSGMATALCRPCSEVRPLMHAYESPVRPASPP